MTYSIEGKKVSLSNGNVASFAYEVADALDFPDAQIVAVRLKIPTKAEFNENVFGLDYNGVIRWKIPETRHVYADSPYVGMRRSGSRLEADNWDGLVLTLDPKTGTILDQTYQK